MISQGSPRIRSEAETTMKAALVSIGDEVVLGESVDTNTAWIAAQLAERAVSTVEHRSVPDDRDAIASAVTDLAQKVDLIILTGGLGPTDDDLTREALGAVLNPGEELVTDSDAVNAIEERFARHGRDMPRNNRRQAQRPPSMGIVPNPHGTAPGLVGKHGKCMIFALPGPPGEMQAMFVDHVAPSLKVDPAAPALVTGFVHGYGLGESDAAQLLGELMNRDRNPLIGTTVSRSIITARVRASGPPDRARVQIEADMQRVERLWRPYVYGRGEATLSSAVGELLREAGKTLVTAESCTGGWLGKMLVDVPGSSGYYLGGYVTYSDDMKTTCLAVSHELLEAHGAVSKQVAEAMASGAMANLDADFALAITGIAGPEGGTTSKPVGTVYISLAQVEESLLNVSTRHFVFPGDRFTVRDRSAKAALQMLRFALLGVSEQTPLLWQVPRASLTTAGESQ